LTKGDNALQIETSRFGTITVEEGQVLRLPEGIIGFPEWTRFILLDHREGSPFRWFQSVENHDLAFVLMNPLELVSDYDIDLSPEDSRLLQVDQPAAEIQALVVVNISKQSPREITANLMAPVVINSEKKIGKQVILYQTDYSVRHSVPTRN
jgi:flagellar assembly factor FliW